MVVVEVGTRIVLTGDGTRTTLRALGATDLDGAWALPVLAAATGLHDTTGTIEVATPRGVLTLPARLAVDGAGLTLRAAPRPGGAPAALRQRRDDVRGPLELTVRCAVLPAATDHAATDHAHTDHPRADHAAGHPVDHGEPDPVDRAARALRTGLTTSVSGGGVGLLLHTAPGGARPAPGDLLHLELDLGPGPAVVAVAEVVDASPVLRARFLRIAPSDRERLVRAVFEAERQALARTRGRATARPSIR